MDAGKAGPASAGARAPCEQCVLARQCPVALFAAGAGRPPELDARPRLFKRGARLQREGERLAQVLFVKSGLLAVRQTGMDGVERAIAVIGAGFLVGQPAAHGLPAVMTVQALTAVSVCEFSLPTLQRLQQLGSADPSCVGRYMRQSTVSLVAWSHVARMPGLGQRLASALRTIASFQSTSTIQLPSQALLAELLCVTRESVNRVWKDFEARGIVRRRHARAIDIDLQKLDEVLMPGN